MAAAAYNPAVQSVLTAAQMTALDQYAIGTLGVDSRILMSNAAREVLAAVRSYFPQATRLAILAGPGNNGGDGIALAYYAKQADLEPELYLCAEDGYKASEDGAYFLKLCAAIGLAPYELHAAHMLQESAADADLIVDALFGTGLRSTVSGFFANLFDLASQLPAPVVSVDCPSGLDCTSGLLMGACVRADLTVSFGLPKLGFYHPQAIEYVGELIVRDIGLGYTVPEGTAGISAPDFLMADLAITRKPNSQKNDYGRVLIVAGHETYPGAPRLAAQGALAAGAGLVRLVVPQSIHTACCDDPSVMCAPHSMDGAGGFCAVPDARLLEWLDWADALVIGPGLGSGDAVQLAKALATAAKVPTLVDADALRALPVERESQWPMVLTPHAGELARLLDADPDYVNVRWFEVAQDAAQKHNALLLLKSVQCQLADGELALFPRRGHPALATGGTGDVLAGLCGGLLARIRRTARASGPALDARQCLSACATAVVSAVNIHAAAGALCAGELGENSVSAYDVAQALPKAMKSLIDAARQSMLGGETE